KLEEEPKKIARKDPKDNDKKGGGDKKTENSKSKIKWSIQASTGLSYANQTLTQKTPSTSLLLEHRKNYESSLETLHFGFSIAAQHKSGLGLSIGLQRSEITERYTYQDTRSETNMVDAVVTRRINLSNDTIDIMGELPQVTNIIIDKNIYNKYTLLDLPVIVSYHYRLNEFWNIGAEAGLLINLSLKTKGIIPDASLQDVNIDTNQGDVFNSKIGLGYHFGASVGRNIGKKWSLNISPMLRIYPKDFAVDTYELSQKYVLFGGNLGLTYHFN
ncbi:MAG: hypothetical protein AB8F74_00375, partial [Saprospiraceae bacterium]